MRGAADMNDLRSDKKADLEAEVPFIPLRSLDSQAWLFLSSSTRARTMEGSKKRAVLSAGRLRAMLATSSLSMMAKKAPPNKARSGPGIGMLVLVGQLGAREYAGRLCEGLPLFTTLLCAASMLRLRRGYDSLRVLPATCCTTLCWAVLGRGAMFP